MHPTFACTQQRTKAGAHWHGGARVLFPALLVSWLCHLGTIAVKKLEWASLVAQWLRIHLPMQGTWVRALVWEDPTCRGATKPVSHNY